jgi:hypothetical protein
MRRCSSHPRHLPDGDALFLRVNEILRTKMGMFLSIKDVFRTKAFFFPR